ncbi:serine/threonine-protein kinase RIO1-like [Tubulanus polymorphus]|uniref:serine/threonine-protein kinase RIO1-like n=1 Tax=Tubulanus polymorphus TaxID=672921 RepID=UPI003DA2570F
MEAGQFDDADDDISAPVIDKEHCPQWSLESLKLAVEMGKIDEVIEPVAKVDDTNNEKEDENETWSDDYSEEDDVDDDWDDYTSRDFTKRYNAAHGGSLKPNTQVNNKVNSGKYQPNEKAFNKFSNVIRVDKYTGPKLTSSAASKLIENDRKSNSDRNRGRDKADRATVEQVLDPRTRMIIFKMLNRGFITEINGCVSTGKEANVYHASSKNGQDLAIKVYKTSILVFKDRDKYVTGEFRFRHGYCKHNPRKMVRTWAEKEMRNLTRMYQAGIPCPEPVLLRSHVLLMTFIGNDGWSAPKLKDVDISESKSRELYLQCIQLLRTMYTVAKLVHADLSEFNILYHNGQVYFIDVSQSVEHDHPHALEFLRKDCTNINEFFKKYGVCTMTVKELFDFVTDMTITDENIEDYIEKMMVIASSRSVEEVTEQEKIDEEVFKRAYIPRTLDEVIDIERDMKKVQRGDDQDIHYQTVTGLKPDLTGALETPAVLEDEDEILSGDDETEEENGSHTDSDCDENDSNTKNIRPRDESPNSRKERKKQVKEEQREKRKIKIPKHVKKRKEKTSSTKKGKK